MSRRNPFYFDKTPEDSPVVKAFEANKQEIIKLFMKRLSVRHLGTQFERIMQAIMFQMLSKYSKQKEACYQVIKGLQEANLIGLVNKPKDGQLLVNEAIVRKEVPLVRELLTLNPDIYQKDQNGKKLWPEQSAYSLAQESEHPEISKMIMAYANVDRGRNYRYDTKEYGMSGHYPGPGQGGYSRKGDFRPGDYPDSPHRLVQQGSLGSQTNPGTTKPRKDPGNNIISGNQPSNAQLSLTVPGAKQVALTHKGPR